MPKKNLYLTDDQQAKVDELHRLLKAQGVDLSDPKRPGSVSDSALFRWLVENKLAELQK